MCEAGEDSDSSGPQLYLPAIHPFHFLPPNLPWLPTAYGIKSGILSLVFRALPPSSFSPAALYHPNHHSVISPNPSSLKAFAQGEPSYRKSSAEEAGVRETRVHI